MADAAEILPDGDAIDVEVPLRTEYAATIRLFVASVGADAGFSLDEIDDLKLAVSEVFTQMVEQYTDDDPVGRAHLRLTVSDATIGVHVSAGGHAAPLALDPLSGAILSSVVDAHRVTGDGISLVKRVAESVA
jgi:anti-sigma regulatory factor (Ser/Thr protein kinase)